MFTGLVQALGIVLASAEIPAGRRLTVSLAELIDAPIQPGDSICVSGVCLTVVKIANGNLQFDVITETLNRTSLGQKISQDRVNLELSLRADSFLGGHFVQGHVDALASVLSVQDNPHDWRITFGVPPEIVPYLVPKGSVTVDGVSMTIADVNHNAFTLAVIPTTLERTTLSALKVSDLVNVETDILTRTVVSYLQLLQNSPAIKAAIAPPPTIPLVPGAAEKLRELGLT